MVQKVFWYLEPFKRASRVMYRLGIAIPGSRIPGSRDPGPFSQSRTPGLPTSKSRDFGIEKLLENWSFSVIK